MSTRRDILVPAAKGPFAGMSPAELNTEKKQHHRGKNQAEEQEGISFEIKKFLAKNREHLRRNEANRVSRILCTQGCALYLARRSQAFAEFFP